MQMQEKGKKDYGILLFGDNRVESDRVNRIIKNQFSVVETKGDPTSRVDVLDVNGTEVPIRSCGRYEDWGDTAPRLGTEKSDTIVGKIVPDGDIIPLLSYEHNGSTSAGNNTWQRYPRIHMAVSREVPFVYSIPLVGGSTRDEAVEEIRTENVAMVVCQLGAMIKHGVPCLTLFRDTYWVDYVDEKYDYINCDNWELQFQKILKSVIAEEWIPKEVFSEVIMNMLEYIDNNLHEGFDMLEGHPILSNKKDFISDLYDYIYNDTDLKASYKLNWTRTDFKPSCNFKKSMSTSSKFKDSILNDISYKSSANKQGLLDFCETWSIEADSSMTIPEIKDKISASRKNPLSYRIGQNEVGFFFNPTPLVEMLENTYGFKLNTSDEPICFVPIKGYTPDTGGVAFSRPDKGMISAFRTLFGDMDEMNFVVLLYDEDIPENWMEMIESANDPSSTTRTNNLWRELDKFADTVICDTDSSVWYNE